MAAYIFQQLAKRGKAEGITSKNTVDARNWFRSEASKLGSVNPSRLMNDKENLRQAITIRDIGKMFMFYYDPKLKESLPYYDTFPLIFPISVTTEGFMGLNLHYLSPVLRAKLMDSLYTTISNDKYNDTTKLKINYEMLNSASRFKYFAPCLKQYLWGHVRGNFLYVEPSNWDAAVMMPTERFKKATKEQVFKDSARAV